MAQALDERPGHRLWHYDIALFGEGLLLPLPEHNRFRRLAGALPVFPCASGSQPIVTAWLMKVFRKRRQHSESKKRGRLLEAIS